jgi:DNA-directed RNA polymerase specialized sigma24 family protein
LEKNKELGEPDATIVVQKYYFGRKMAEIAEMTGLNPHAAQVRCGRALKKLRKDMEQWR